MIRVTCDQSSCDSTVDVADHGGVVTVEQLGAVGWQSTPYGEFCPRHHKVLRDVPPRPRKVVHGR